MSSLDLEREIAERLHAECPDKGQECPRYGVYVRQAREIISKVRAVVADEVQEMRLPVAPLHYSREPHHCRDGVQVHLRAIRVINGEMP